MPHLKKHFEWVSTLPSEPFDGIVVANEVLDAMPIHKFNISSKILEYYVTNKDNEFTWHLDQISSKRFHPVLDDISKTHFQNTTNYDFEVNFYLQGWLQSVHSILSHGAVLLIDYGFVANEMYHPSRDTGTLMCHYQHTAHDNPLTLVGQQDITSHVDFSHVANISHDIGFAVSGFTTQASFLLNTGITNMLETNDDKEHYRNSQQVKMLTLPSEMGELFKIIALTKDLSLPLTGFMQMDLRHQL